MDIVISLALDLAVVAIFIIAVVIGAKRGLIKALIGVFGHVIALVLALMFSVQLGAYLNEHYLREPLRDWVINQLTAEPSDAETDVSSVKMDELFKDTPTFFKEMVDYLGNIGGHSMDDLREQFDAAKQYGIKQATSAIVDSMVGPLAEIVSRVIAFLIIYVLAYIAIRILWHLSDLIAKIPLVRTFNGLGGGILGALTGVLVVFVFTAIAHLSSPYVLKDYAISDRVAIYERTYVYKVVCEYNPLNTMFSHWFNAEEPAVTSDGQEALPSDGTETSSGEETA